MSEETLNDPMRQDPDAEARDKDGNLRKTFTLTNGKTFHGSDKELREFMEEENDNKG